MTSYDPNFFDVINAGSRRSALLIAPLLLKELLPGFKGKPNIVDVGCGEGAWASTLVELGCEVTGLDGDYVEPKRLKDGFRFIATDLADPIGPLADGPFDMALSLEVAEHLPEKRARGFVEDLAELSDLIVFSAAIPGQGGTGHCNEQWPRYWQSLFDEAGYAMTGAFRWLIWNEPDVSNWYSQNLMVCVPYGQTSKFPLFAGPCSDPFAVVHPTLWDHVRPR